MHTHAYCHYQATLARKTQKREELGNLDESILAFLRIKMIHLSPALKREEFSSKLKELSIFKLILASVELYSA
jgi:hypothetical protein